ncbi:MAG: terminase family protein [Pseudomonadota bacterium]
MTTHAKKSCAASLALLSAEKREAFLDSLSDNAVVGMPYVWEVWANPLHQVEPEGDWLTWVILGGRGAGKTRAGAEWVRARAEGPTVNAPGKSQRIALVGATIEQVRQVMVEGESGIIACSPPDRRPKFMSSRNKLVWQNGAEATLLSATNYEALRGPQFDAAWCDELAKWRNGRDAWDMLQFTLRLGDDPRQIVTTTPRDVRLLREILSEGSTVVSHAGTEANTGNLAPGFLERLRARYGGTALGRQELDGELIANRDGALWTLDLIDAARKETVGPLTRIVVAVDPPVSTGKKADECGIVVAGVNKCGALGEWQVEVLEDLSCKGLSPQGWAEIAARAYEDHKADRLVAEINQGGALVEAVMRQVAPNIAYRGVHALQGKRIRAEPVAALYEQGRVHHVGVFNELEDQMCAFTQGRGSRSPDRVDALVWAITDLVLCETEVNAARVRSLGS